VAHKGYIRNGYIPERKPSGEDHVRSIILGIMTRETIEEIDRLLNHEVYQNLMAKLTAGQRGRIHSAATSHKKQLASEIVP